MADREQESPTRTLGRYGEDLAARYLGERGMQVLDRNWRCEHGEIDLVALDGDCLVVCEVKTRRSTAFGEPVEAVTWRKAARPAVQRHSPTGRGRSCSIAAAKDAKGWARELVS